MEKLVYVVKEYLSNPACAEGIENVLLVSPTHEIAKAAMNQRVNDWRLGGFTVDWDAGDSMMLGYKRAKIRFDIITARFKEE